MGLLFPWISLLLISAVTSPSSAVEMTSSSWRCVDRDKTHNLTSADCSCRSADTNGLVWSNVDCTRRNFTHFASNAVLTLFIDRLDLSRNNITSLEQSPFQHWNPVKHLILSYNGMVSIVDGPFSGLELLRKLDLSHNRLTLLPSDLVSKNERLLSIDLSFNNITFLPPDVFSSTLLLESIKLNRNIKLGTDIQKSSSALSVAFKNGLKHLELNSVNLSYFPPNFFSEALSLEELYIADNPFTTVPDLFIGSLQVLNLSGCAIEVINPGNFITLPLIQDLYLDRLINLTEVKESAFESLESLRTVSMDNCVDLKSFHRLAFDSPSSSVSSLRRVSLAQGGLQVLSPELKSILKKVDEVQLHGNPWHCDCNLAWLLELNLTVHERKKLRCFSPPHLRAAHIFSLTPDQMVCPQPVSRVRSGLVIALAVLLGLLCMAIVVAALEYVRRHRWRYARRVGRYEPIEVQLQANRAEYGWDSREIAKISVSQSSATS